MGIVYKDVIDVVYKTLNSISKKGYNVFIPECVVYRTEIIRPFFFSKTKAYHIFV